VNKKVIVLAMLAALAATTPALAEKGDFWFGLNTGVSSPTGDAGESTDLGFQGTLVTNYMLTPAFGVGADIGYHWWGVNDDFIPAGAEANSNVIQATAQGTYMFQTSGKMMPYLKGGLGLYRGKAEVSGATDPLENFETTSSDFGYNIGGGMNWNVSPMYQMGVGAQYHSIQTDVESTNFYTVGVNLLWGKN
jgi:opacity protein-like surface antigen